MDTKKLLVFLSYFHFSASIDLRELLPRVMLMFCSFLWASFRSFIFDLLEFINKFIFRLGSNDANTVKHAASFGASHSLSDDHTDQNSGGFGENEKDFNQNREETEDSVFNQDGLISSESKYQFMSSKNVSTFITEPKFMINTVEELFVGSNNVGITNKDTQFQSKEGFRVLDECSNDGSVHEDLSEDISENIDEFVGSLWFEENLERAWEIQEEEPSDEFKILEDESRESNNKFDQNQDFVEELIFLEGEKIYLSSGEFANGSLNLETSTIDNQGEIIKFNKSTEVDIRSFGSSERGIVVCKNGEDIYDEDIKKLKSYFDDHSDDPVESISQENVSRCERQEFEGNLQEFEENTDSEEEEFDILQEHKYFVKQMKMEMRYSKLKGLPTISEECESQETSVDDLKPLNIYQKLGYKDHMAEIQMFYGSYAEKMKKLDILNYQTLHAISFLHLKDSKALMGSNRSPISLIKGYIPKLWPYKQHKIYADSTYKMASATHQDLELVYVGQVCNSWEMLRWQYAKAKELLECDSDQRHHSSYNKVASEYQQFQVLLERFLEDEAFHGPRILHFVNYRYIFRTLLRIPMIKEDCLKVRKASETEEEQRNVSLAELADMIKQSMQVFWEFLSTENTERKIKLNARTEVDKHGPAEAKLLKDIRITLQQKEKRLKDILRSRNCIVKKFKKCQNGAQYHAVLSSQVELKLLSSVLSLNRMSIDQLIWCQKKLDNISFLGRKVLVEHSILLFPC